MAIISVRVDNPVIRTSESTSGYSQRCFVQFDSAANVDTQAALTATDSHGNAVPVNAIKINGATYTITSKNTSRNGAVVTVDLEWSLFTGDSPEKPENGTVWRLKVDTDTMKMDDHLRTVDYSDNPIRVGFNTAGDRTNLELKTYKYLTVYHITYRTSVFPETYLETVRGYYNNAAVTFTVNGTSKTFDTLTLLCDRAATTMGYETKTGTDGKLITTAYWDVAIDLHYNKEKWLYKVESMGFNELDSNGNLKPIMNRNWNNGVVTQTKVAYPWPLDANGYAVLAATKQGYLYQYQCQPKASFAFLNGIGSVQS